MGYSFVAIPIFNKRANASAEEYWRMKSLRSEGGRSKKEELEEIEKLLDKGIGGKLREELEKRASQLRSEVMGEAEASQRMKDVVRDLLELTSRFAPNLDPKKGKLYPYDPKQGPIHEGYFMAITEIIFGEPRDCIEFEDAILSPEGIEIRDEQADEIESLRILNRVTTMIQESAKKKLGLSNQFDEAWLKLLEQDFAYRAFEMIVKNRDGMSLDEIQEACHRVDHEYQELVRDIYDERLKDELERMLSDDLWENRLIERTGDGIYTATEFGRWMWQLCSREPVKIGREVKRERSSLEKLKVLRDKVGGRWRL
ncbi:MAG TPA: hypothetical protein ENG09_01710 [Candidatus Syntrophoarchaeum butanivorans]|uniref:Uncharacterized protein n=1 Tax=Candidatus Syntropharchaeum butanivorans TaxID=1839936 RepID=A0A7C1B3A3_9EURY|nr:hypothetical protein [Candidatus Syntrophoarchaeum butanivorans]